MKKHISKIKKKNIETNQEQLSPRQAFEIIRTIVVPAGVQISPPAGVPKGNLNFHQRMHIESCLQDTQDVNANR